MTTAKKRFLIVDDDPINNFLSKSALKRTLGEVLHVDDFVIPEDGLRFIENEPCHDPPDGKTTLLLDINMPTMTGWEFLDKFNSFNEFIKEQYTIFILSSSVDPNDISRAKTNPLVMGFLEKPLGKDMLQKILG